MKRLPKPWRSAGQLSPLGLTCGHCNHYMSSNTGFHMEDQARLSRQAFIYICSHCRGPNYILMEADMIVSQVPGSAFGASVDNVPEAVGSLYDEARNCMKVSAYTSAVLACRKLLMNIAVAEGAAEGKKFIDYVKFLATKGYVPPGGKHWVDHIRKQGNEATHEIQMKSVAEAEDLISFVEMLLKFIYEFPARVPSAASPPANGT